eukprot:TRINITY_DN1666_c0_g1_i1.p1 TRINITY_DN1666_c0_g1~~TRINITY_DN1666_c0_g1_i1.p1  ORF type:complete len:316 (-),score=52.69 TRINITY_DN1666_c0_g1_i1:7-933(-)
MPDLPPVKYAGYDVFDRQRNGALGEAWKQDKIEQQVALVLGCGGIGSGVAMGLCRLGIRKMFLVDFDTVDTTNLNRQILFSKSDVGKLKVQAATETLNHLHNLRTEIIPLAINAVDHWSVIVDIARESTVIFNSIDFGEWFDVAAASLAISLSIPYNQASSYGLGITFDSFDAEVRGTQYPCFLCDKNPKPTDVHKVITYPENVEIEYNKFELASRLCPAKIQDFTDLKFLPRYVPLQTRQFGSSVTVCTSACMAVVHAWVSRLCGNRATPNNVQCFFHEFSTIAMTLDKNPMCLFCGVGPEMPSADA